MRCGDGRADGPAAQGAGREDCRCECSWRAGRGLQLTLWPSRQRRRRRGRRRLGGVVEHPPARGGHLDRPELGARREVDDPAPLAVVLDGEGPEPTALQRRARGGRPAAKGRRRQLGRRRGRRHRVEVGREECLWKAGRWGQGGSALIHADGRSRRSTHSTGPAGGSEAQARCGCSRRTVVGRGCRGGRADSQLGSQQTSGMGGALTTGPPWMRVGREGREVSKARSEQARRRLQQGGEYRGEGREDTTLASSRLRLLVCRRASQPLAAVSGLLSERGKGSARGGARRRAAEGGRQGKGRPSRCLPTPRLQPCCWRPCQPTRTAGTDPGGLVPALREQGTGGPGVGGGGRRTRGARRAVSAAGAGKPVRPASPDWAAWGLRLDGKPRRGGGPRNRARPLSAADSCSSTMPCANT